MFFREKVNKIGEIKISYRQMIFLEGIIMAITLLSISWISTGVFYILKENIKSVYLEPAIMIAAVIWMIYLIPKIAKMPDMAVINRRAYSQNMQRIYEVLNTKKGERIPDIPMSLLEIPVNMFHDQMKQNGRNFTPDIAHRITRVIQKIERLPHRQNWET